ncbi:S66 family peptidase [Candidatus Absconditicoccus praedator]|uniref:S66 family peptidase n=1 Tax=Candidatus Absconditicoccus praedator TaxID=2735562 RepID=UPI001E519D99|nr:S66 peptidase family protein [Candidatus Absconditicoccus praedator]UFX83125.1 LD-carboxypeptidase [Candidatus Absconditicoccus praedator]
MIFKIPKKLKKGSKIAVVSSSWGGPGTFPYRYNNGIKQLKEHFGVEIIEMENTIKDPGFVYNNPKKRAEDLMNAFLDSSIDAIFSSIGGDDSIRILPYIDFNIIRNNPKIYMGYSDSTITHFICYKAGLRSYYGPAIMAGFAENAGMFEYMIESVEKTLFNNNIIGEIKPNTNGWTNEFLDWGNPENLNIKRKLNPNTGWRFLQGNGLIKGELLGGCIDVFYFMWGTELWPTADEWKGKIMFFETSEENISEGNLERILRTMGVQGILENINGIIVGRAQDEKNYNESILKIVKGEFGLDNLPIITNMDFGHTDPMFVIPMGAETTLDMDNQKVFINESGVL